MKQVTSLLLIAPCVLAQVVYREDILRTKYQPYLSSSPSLKFNYATFSLPPYIDNEVLINDEKVEQSAREESDGKRSGYFQFGKAFEVDLDLTDGTWLNLPDGSRLWRLALESHNAFSLNVLFSDFEIPPEAEFYVSSLVEDDQEVRGPFTSENNKVHRQFSFLPVHSNKILLELYVSNSQLPSLTISHIVHGFKDTKGRSGACNINVACKAGDDWSSQAKGVAMMLTNNGQGYCSGSMINSIPADGRQLFLTAFHCVGRDVSRDLIRFNFQAKTCDGRQPPSTTDSAQGLKKLASWSLSDFAIFEVEEEIPESYNVYLNGWSAEIDGYIPKTPVGIHHPSADIKKITFSDVDGGDACWSSACGRRPADHWKISQWARGTTEPGSSGSPLFDGKTKRIVGQLHGGSASCWNTQGYDVYGKIQASFDRGERGQRLKDVLDPEDTGARFQDGVFLAEARRKTFVQQRL